MSHLTPSLCSTECQRKSNAENFPRNFALIRLAEKTAAKLKAEEEEQKKSEIEALERQIAEAEKADKEA